jgi:hypothetical protein
MRTVTGALRLLWPLFLVLLLTLVLVSVSAQDANLLTNPGFEAPYVEVEEVGQVAEGWEVWNLPPDITRPEFSEIGEDEPERIREGEGAQKYSSFLTTHNAGVYQVVEGVPEDTALEFSVFAWVWSSESGLDRDVSDNPGAVTVEVGIDPTGGTDPESAAIIWSEPVEEYDDWVQHSVVAQSAGTTATVFVRSIAGTSRVETVVYLDEASLTPTDAEAVETPEVVQPEVTEEVVIELTATATEEVEAVITETPVEQQETLDAPVTPTQDDFAMATAVVETATAEVLSLTQTAEGEVGDLQRTQEAVNTLAAQQTQNAIIAGQQTEAAATQTAAAVTQEIESQPGELTTTPVVIVITTTPQPTNTPGATAQPTFPGAEATLSAEFTQEIE